MLVIKKTTPFYRIQELNDTETAEDAQLKRVAGDLVKNTSSDPKLSQTEFMKYVAGLAGDSKSSDWADEFLQKACLILFLK